jgi:hypothetical protein
MGAFEGWKKENPIYLDWKTTMGADLRGPCMADGENSGSLQLASREKDMTNFFFNDTDDNTLDMISTPSKSFDWWENH